MLPGESSKRAVAPALGSGGSIDALPDGVLEHILGFLLAPEAVRTSVLARRWRRLWMSAPALRVGCLSDDVGALPPLKECREFVDRLLRRRRGSRLDTCDFRLGQGQRGQDQRDDIQRVNCWLWHVIKCKVRLLKLHIHWGGYLLLHDLSLVSKHLTRLELRGVLLRSNFLDFSSCPALGYLELLSCSLLMAKKIASNSLKHLSITDSQFRCDFSTCISAPNLVSLHLDDPWLSSPMLDSMPLLVEAFVRINEDYRYSCGHSSDCLCESCESARDATGNSCVLFKGLSKAKSLVLMCTASDSVLFKWDLRWCPVFSKLKTLVLNEYWCMPDDFRPLLCILQHSPVLQELTLELFSEGPKYEVEMKGSISPMERSTTISEHLNIVKVKCLAVNARVLKILKLLCTFNIRFGF